MDYLIPKTDPANGTFTIKPYTTNGPQTPTAATPLATHAISANTSLVLLGQGMAEYGAIVAADFVHLLENFAGPTAPVYPIQGQLWYKNDTQELLLHHSGSDWATPTSVVLNGKLTTGLDVNSQVVTNLADPVNPTDAVNLSYLVSHALTTAGAIMLPAANITFSGGGEILGLPAIPSVDTAAASKKYVDDLALADGLAFQSWATAQFVELSGDTMTGNLTMSPNARIYVPTPVGGFLDGSEVVNKDYIDNGLFSINTFVEVAGDTMTGPLEIDGASLLGGAVADIVNSDITTNTISVDGNHILQFLPTVRLTATLDATPGYQTVDVGGAIDPFTPTGITGNIAPVSGYQYVNVGGNKTGASSTGLTPNIPATNGYQEVNVGGAKTGASATGLNNDVPATAGYQEINVGGAKTGASSTGLAINTPTTAGYQIVTFNDNKIGASATGLANDATVYTASISVDGVAKPIAITGSAAQTYTTLLAEINTDLGASAVAAIDTGAVKITSNTLGVTSTILINDTNLFSSLLDYNSISPAVQGTDTPGATHTASISVDGVAKPIAITGSAAQTYTTLLAEINTDLGASATAALVGGNIRITSATTGVTSTIDTTDTGLFSGLADFVAVSAAVGGVGIIVTTYTATILVDGVSKSISVNGGAALTYTNLLSEINIDLGVSAVATLVGGNIRVTSATFGSASTVSITDGDLFSTLIDFVSITAAVGGVNIITTTYTASIAVDGIAKPISILGNSAQTYNTLLSEINADLGASAVAALDVGNIKITSASTGVTSTIAITDSGLFSSLTGFVSIPAAVPGDDVVVSIYTATIVVDGISVPISIVGSAVASYGALVDEINVDLAPLATIAIVNYNLQVTSATAGISSTIAISDVDLFSSLPDYVSTLPAVNGYNSQTGSFSVVSSTYNSTTDNTDIVVDGLIMVTTTPGSLPPVGSILPIVALALTNGASARFSGNVQISNGYDVNFGNNIIHGIADPLVDTDAANKKYADDAAALAVVGAVNAVIDGHLTDATFVDNTLTLTTTTGSGTYDTIVSGIADKIHTHETPNISHNVIGTTSVDSYFRDTYRNLSPFALPNSNYPAIASSDLFNAIDDALYNTSSPNDRTIYTFESESVTNVSDPYDTLLYSIVNRSFATTGYQQVNLGGIATLGGSTGLVASIPATSGYQVVNVGGAKVGGDPTGLTNDATVYTASISVDGVAKPIAITGSTAQTFTALLAEINTDLGASAVAALDAGNIKITSATTGVASTIAITDTDLFLTLTGFVSIQLGVNGTDTSSPTYTANITVDGVLKAISILGSAAQTYTTLLSEINTDLGASATAALSGGNIRVTSATTGLSSTVSIADTDLFSSLTDFISIDAAVQGAAGSYTISGGDFTSAFTPGLIITITRNTGVPANTAHTVSSSVFNVGPNTTTILVTENVDPATTGDGIIGSAVVGVTTGVGGSFTISGGDYTQAFQPGIQFVVDDFVQPISYYTASSSYSATGPFGPNTTIVVDGTIGALVQASGFILPTYGAFEILGNLVSKFLLGVKFNLAANSNAPSNGDYLVDHSSTEPGKTHTWIYLMNSTPKPVLTTGDGVIIPYSMVLPFQYGVETNKLQVYLQGVKQYNSTRGFSKITVTGVNSNIIEWKPTPLSSPGNYTFDVAVDGGVATTINVPVTYTLGVNTFSVIGVDTVDNFWTVDDNTPTGFFGQYDLIEVVGNVGLGVNTPYTVKTVVNDGVNTIIYVNEPILGGDVSGQIQLPYSYTNLLAAIQTQFNLLFPLDSVPVIKYHRGKMYIYSPTSGTNSEITITDGTLFDTLGLVGIENAAAGVEYGYKEIGRIFQSSSIIELPVLPTLGDVYECIVVG